MPIRGSCVLSEWGHVLHTCICLNPLGKNHRLSPWRSTQSSKVSSVVRWCANGNGSVYRRYRFGKYGRVKITCAHVCSPPYLA